MVQCPCSDAPMLSCVPALLAGQLQLFPTVGWLQRLCRGSGAAAARPNTVCLQQVVLCRDCPQRVLQEQEGDRGESGTARHQDHQPQRQTAQRGERVAASAAQVYLIKPQSNPGAVLRGQGRGSSLGLALLSGALREQ